MKWICKALGHNWNFSGASGDLICDEDGFHSTFDNYECTRCGAWFKEPFGIMVPENERVIYNK